MKTRKEKIELLKEISQGRSNIDSLNGMLLPTVWVTLDNITFDNQGLILTREQLGKRKEPTIIVHVVAPPMAGSEDAIDETPWNPETQTYAVHKSQFD